MSFSKTSQLPPTLSYWELNQYFTDIDLLVIGSGIVGLTTAIFYQQKNPSAKVVVIEKGFLPSGASTKNAGFACFGSLSEIISDLKSSSEDEVFDLLKQRYAGLLELQKLVGTTEIGFEPIGGFELFRKSDEIGFDECEAFASIANTEIEKRIGLKDTYQVARDKIAKFGFSDVDQIIVNQHEGAIDTGKMMNRLLMLANSLGVNIFNGLELGTWSELKTGVAVSLTNGFEFKVSRLHIATNGFASRVLPELDVKPARAQVLITSPIPTLKFQGTFHLEEGFYYFRNVGKRVLLGGGRNLALEQETTDKISVSRNIQEKLEELLTKVILPKEDYQIEHRWAGIMGIGETKKPIIKHISKNVSCSVRLGGMGVALGTSIGKQSAELLKQKRD